MNVLDIAEKYGLKPKTIRKAINEGRLPAKKQGVNWYIDPAHAELYSKGARVIPGYVCYTQHNFKITAAGFARRCQNGVYKTAKIFGNAYYVQIEEIAEVENEKSFEALFLEYYGFVRYKRFLEILDEHGLTRSGSTIMKYRAKHSEEINQRTLETWYTMEEAADMLGLTKPKLKSVLHRRFKHWKPRHEKNKRILNDKEIDAVQAYISTPKKPEHHYFISDLATATGYTKNNLNSLARKNLIPVTRNIDGNNLIHEQNYKVFIRILKAEAQAGNFKVNWKHYKGEFKWDL